MRRGVGGDVESVRRGEEVVDVGGARVGDGREDDVVVGAGGIAAGGVEEREEDLRHLGEVLVAETTEEQSARTGVGKLGDGGAEAPCAGGVVGDVEQDVGREEFEAARPVGVANAGFDGGGGDVVICSVTQMLCSGDG